LKRVIHDREASKQTHTQNTNIPLPNLQKKQTKHKNTTLHTHFNAFEHTAVHYHYHYLKQKKKNYKKYQLLTMDILAFATMKNAANCDT